MPPTSTRTLVIERHERIELGVLLISWTAEHFEPATPTTLDRDVGQCRPPRAGRAGHHEYASRPVTGAFEQVFHLRELTTPPDQGHYRTLFRAR
jgi:hypothetical protein